MKREKTAARFNRTEHSIEKKNFIIQERAEKDMTYFFI